MQYQIALDPELGLSAEDVAGRWNQESSRGAMTAASPTRGSFDPDLAQAGLMVVSNIATSLFAALIYDTVKSLILERGRSGEPKVEIHEGADGKTIVVVTIEK